MKKAEEIKNLQEAQVIPDDLEIIQQKLIVLQKKGELAQAEDKLKEMIKNFQEKCRHEWQAEKKFDSSVGKFGKDIITGYFCEKCLANKPRRIGHPWDVCQVCGATMNFDGIVPGQGEKTHYYICSDPACRHEYSHT